MRQTTREKFRARRAVAVRLKQWGGLKWSRDQLASMPRKAPLVLNLISSPNPAEKVLKDHIAVGVGFYRVGSDGVEHVPASEYLKVKP